MSEIMVPMMIIAMIIVAIITWFAARNYERKQYDSKVGSAEEKSREIIDEALKTAETDNIDKLQQGLILVFSGFNLSQYPVYHFKGVSFPP